MYEEKEQDDPPKRYPNFIINFNRLHQHTGVIALLFTCPDIDGSP